MITSKLKAKSIYLRLVQENDAKFICDIRNNEDLNSYISSSTNDEDLQKKWIRTYKTRESNGSEYYFIICRNNDDLPIGTVRLYDFKENPNAFCWGSWILNENKTKTAAIESALLVYQFGFDRLGFEQSHYDVRKDNEKVHSFHTKMGAMKIDEDKDNIYYIFTKQAHKKAQAKYVKFLEVEK